MICITFTSISICSSIWSYRNTFAHVSTLSERTIKAFCYPLSKHPSIYLSISSNPSSYHGWNVVIHNGAPQLAYFVGRTGLLNGAILPMEMEECLPACLPIIWKDEGMVRHSIPIYIHTRPHIWTYFIQTWSNLRKLFMGVFVGRLERVPSFCRFVMYRALELSSCCFLTLYLYFWY